MILKLALDSLSDNEARRLYDSQVSSGVAQVQPLRQTATR